MPTSYLCLAGPTASGKTAAALAIADAVADAFADAFAGASPPRRIEIISVDSALVFRGMDIGTAKPSAAERAAVPHHLIDIVEPTATYSASRFVADARRLIGEIRARGALPLLVGGTMLYFKALFDGLDEMPPTDLALRARFAERLRREGLPALHAELQRDDPVTAARLPPGDTQRILRALEVFAISGRPLSSFHGVKDASPAIDRPPLISLEPSDRAWLHARIARRFEQMLADGFVDEVRALRARGDLDPDMTSMRCVGYRQAWEALDSGDLAALPERGIAATRQLAKRQLTWLRSMPWRHAVACDAPDATARAVELALRLMPKGGTA